MVIKRLLRRCCSNAHQVASCLYKHTIHHCCHFRRPLHMKDEPVDVWGFLQTISVNFLLEVCGASGAIWGTSEVVTLRRNSTTEFWRLAAIGAGLVFLMRFWWHAKHYFQHERGYLPIKLHHRRTHKLPFIQIFSTKFVLEVCGSSGAIWGCSEALALRNDSEDERDWRIAATLVGTAFVIRWIIEILSYCLYFPSFWTDPSSVLMTMARWYEMLIVKLILEVFGACGAVWGFSEVVLLRTSHTLAFWRPLALGTGMFFAGRWLYQVRSFIQGEKRSIHTSDMVQSHDATPQEVQDLEISDLSLTESSASAPKEGTQPS